MSKSESVEALSKNCPRCRGTGEVVKKNESGEVSRLICSCRGLIIAKRMLGSLFPYFDPTKESNKKISLSEKFNAKNLFIHYTKGETSYKKILSLILFRKKISKFELVDAYRLMEMYLGKDEEYSSPRDLVNKNHALVIRFGQTELNVAKFDEIVKMTLLLASTKPDLFCWVVSPHSLASPYLKDFYETSTLPLLKDNESIFEKVKL